jgi:hypothetical protein
MAQRFCTQLLVGQEKFQEASPSKWSYKERIKAREVKIFYSEIATDSKSPKRKQILL